MVLALFGLTLLWPALADRLARPFVQMGSSLAQSSNAGANPGVFRSLLLGVATGLLWAPCAGPILGLLLTGAAVEGGSVEIILLRDVVRTASCSRQIRPATPLVELTIGWRRFLGRQTNRRIRQSYP